MPLQDIFWTTLMVAGFVLAVWLVVIVLRDVFGRDDLSAGAKMAWTLFACFVPILGGLCYLITQGTSPEQMRLDSTRRRTAQIYE